MSKVVELAQGKWVEILTALGISEHYLNGRHGPCPLCGGKDRYRFDNKAGTGSYFCSQCGPGYGFHLLRNFHGWDFPTAAKAVESILGLGGYDFAPTNAAVCEKPKIDNDENIRRCFLLWRDARIINDGDLAFEYFKNRGIILAPEFGAHLRFHPRVNYFENGEVTQFPAVVAAVTDADGSGVAILRTYILDGRKAPVANPRKLTAGGIPAGSAVRLRQAARKMGVAEGIENALAASVLFDVPVWAALTAAGLKRWTPPSEAEEIYIFGDNDRTGIGQGAAEALAVKLRAQGLAVTVRIPDMAGEDWNDALLSKISVGYIRRPPARANQELEALNLRPSHYSHQTTELGGPRHQEPPLR